ncbi:MAG TPA: hypothetical protein VN289_13605 [Paraburkholderia sp.]|nr:hypothetical protein [Paraburkholderia sp.]
MDIESNAPLFRRIRMGEMELPNRVDMVAFGRPYIANPDLAARLAIDAPLAEVDWPTVYGSTAGGYIDYPAFQAVAA